MALKLKQKLGQKLKLFLQLPARYFFPLSELREAIWKRAPVFAELMDRQGSETLFDSMQSFFEVEKAPRFDARKPELVLAVQDLLTPRLGSEIARAVAAQLQSVPLVSTIDHHGPIDHPFFVNSNLISAIPYFAAQNPLLKYLVVFSFSSISMNNASAFSRGLLFHGFSKKGAPLLKLPILPSKLNMRSVYGMRPYSDPDLRHACLELEKYEREGKVSSERAGKIQTLLKNTFGAQDLLDAPDFVTQITILNHRLWPRYFGSQVSDLVYLEIETLVTELLLRHHVGRPDSLIHQLLFDPKARPLIHKYFNNIRGGFSLEQNKGTYLFWGVDEAGYRTQMKAEDLPDTPEAMIDALKSKRLFPGMLLCYLMVSLYYGMKCLGGFCQVNDLTQTRRAWAQLLCEWGKTDEASDLSAVNTKAFGGDGLILAKGTGLDLMLEDKKVPFEHYVKLSKRSTLSEMVAPMLPEIYTILYAAHERDPRFKIKSSETL